MCACICACVHACMHPYVHACVHVSMHPCMSSLGISVKCLPQSPHLVFRGSVSLSLNLAD